VVESPVVVATCATDSEAASGLGILEERGITAHLRPAGKGAEIVVPARDAPAARRALLDDRLLQEARSPREMSLMMKLALVITFLVVVAFAVLTVTLG
jgi:hypothetical protein